MSHIEELPHQHHFFFFFFCGIMLSLVITYNAESQCANASEHLFKIVFIYPIRFVSKRNRLDDTSKTALLDVPFLFNTRNTMALPTILQSCYPFISVSKKRFSLPHHIKQKRTQMTGISVPILPVISIVGDTLGYVEDLKYLGKQLNGLQ